MIKTASKSPRGFGLRQSSGALASQARWLKSGRGLPQSKTLSRHSADRRKLMHI
jgi:hypothetical protein